MDKRSLEIKLIQEVKKNECLYNLLCPEYKEFDYKERAWAKIGEVIGKSALESKKKWKYLRDNYKRSIQKPPVQGVYKPYKYAEYINFLDAVFRRQEPKPILPSMLDDEVSTDATSNDEYQYEIPENLIKCDFNNPFTVTRELFDSSVAVKYAENGHLNAKTDADFDRTTDIQSVSQKIVDTEECTISFKEKQVDENNWVERLIEEVKKYECIYNKRSAEYKDFEYKKRVWHRIGKKLGLKGTQVSRKWKNLKDSYRKYKIGAKTEGFAKHKYAASLKFLEDYITIDPSTSMNLSEVEISTELSSDDEIQYKRPKKEAVEEFQNSLEDIQDSWNESSMDIHYTNDVLNQDNNSYQVIEQDEEFIKTPKDDTDSEECSVSSDAQQNLVRKDLSRRIIEEVKKHDCIYNKYIVQYTNYPFKQRLWHKIGKRLGLTEKEVRVKWKNLRDAYRRHKIKSITEGSAVLKKHKYDEYLSFLDDFMDLPKTVQRENQLPARNEISTDFSSESEFSAIQELPTFPTVDPITIQNVPEPAPPTATITTRLFQLLANKIQEANLTIEQKNDIEYAVSAVVYSKLAEYCKTKHS